MCFDWLFNFQIPESTDKVVVIRPAGKTFVTGLASSYDEDYDGDLLKGRLTMHQFTDMIEKINDNL